MAISEDLKKTFLPPQPSVAGPPPVKTPSPPAANRANPRDRALEEYARKNVLQALGDYAWKKLHRIEEEYRKQITTWKSSFGEVLAAYGTAVGRRDDTLKAAEAERAQDAAFDSFIFSLLTAGAMRFLGTYIQYTAIPRIKVARHTYKWNHYDWRDGLPSMEKVPLPPLEFSRGQAALFGGLAQDIGNRVAGLDFPKPDGGAHKSDSWFGVENMRADFNKLVDGSAQKVLDQFSDAKDWMNEEAEFGAAWAAHAGGDEEKARQAILRHFGKLRDQWARDWEFFGKTPNPIDRAQLADSYERALWASHLLDVLVKALAEAKQRPTQVGSGYPSGSWNPGHGIWVGRKVIENAIVDRMRDLNVVFAETEANLFGQLMRINEGAPKPEVVVDGRVDFEDEVKGLIDWAKGFLKRAPVETERRFFPPARPRRLESL